MTYRPRYMSDDTGLNAMNVLDASRIRPVRLTHDNTRPLPNLQSEMAHVELDLMRNVMNARIRAAQQINELRLYQASMNTSIASKPPRGGQSPTKGLDLLGSIITTIREPNRRSSATSTTALHVIPPSPSYASAINPITPSTTSTPPPNIHQQPATCNPDGSRLYITVIQDWDVLCGRGGKSNHHSGNKRYRHVVSEMKNMYRQTEAKQVKTDLSRAIVEHVCNYGGRFVKPEAATGRYYVLDKAEARKKTSQALRETKALKWTH